MTKLTGTGFLRTRLDERLAELQASMQAIFGPSINLDPDTMDGQTIGMFAEFISNLDQLAEEVYHAFNPQSAVGATLSRLVQLNGIRRIGGTRSTVDLKVVGSMGTIIPAGSLVKSSIDNSTFETLSEVTIDASGEAIVTAQATKIGAVSAAIGTLTKIDTPIFGWQTVTNEAAAEMGRDEETDEQLRIRRKQSTSTPAQAVVDSVHGALLNIPSVLQAKVYENETNVVDANGLPPHSIYAVVEGGDVQQILDTIWLKKSAGCTLVGAATGTVLDSMGNPHTLRFDRPTDVNIYVTINMTTKSGWPTDGAQRIKDAIVAWGKANQEIGEELVWNRLYTPINSVPGVSVTDLFIGTAPAPNSDANIVVPFNGLARFDVARIVVNVA